MPTIRVSSDFTISIPEDLREELDITPGQEVELVRSGDRIEVVPRRPITEARGFLKGMSTKIEREEDRT